LYYRIILKGDGILLNYDNKIGNYSFFRVVYVNESSVDHAIALGRRIVLDDLRLISLNDDIGAIQIGCEECIELPDGDDSINQKYGFMWAPSEVNR